MDTAKINHLSLCSGYGGIDLGLRSVLPDVRTIAYVEIEAFACANLVEKMESKQLDEAPVWTNIKTFDARPFRGVVDILSGGFPCQPFSHAGKRKGTDDPRHLFPDIERIIMECEPGVIFLENVEGIISAKYRGTEQSVLHHVLERLERMGYRAEAGIFSAEEVGTPHRRKRVFIAGVRNTHNCRKPIESKHDEAPRLQKHCLGDTEHDGLPPIKELRSDEETGDNWRKEESSTPRKSKGTSGPANVPGIQGCTEGSKSKVSNDDCGGRTNNVANSDCERSQGHSEEPRGSDSLCTQEAFSVFSGGFPAHPEQSQHIWEAPRTIGNEEVVTAVGGATYGIANGDMVRSCRLDALRLLGNGVVPATCEKAFIVLMSKIR